MDSSTSPHGRKRAPTMSPQARREAIIEATMPLLTEHGTAITTKQIATAAGIAEGTVFRVFEDKAELILACLHASMRSDAE
ncbi:MAG: TetR/AcrR family transcriptional regulator, partial [Sciscionella sp.]